MEVLLNAIVKPFVSAYEAIPSPWNMILAIILGLLVGFFVLMVRRVPQDKKAIRMRWGAVVFDNNGRARIANPGFNLVVPWMRDYELVNSLDKNFDLQDLTIEYSKYSIYTFQATVRFHVEYVYGVRYIVEDFVNTLTSACADDLRVCLEKFPPAEINSHREEISALFAGMILKLAEELGTTFVRLSITNVRPDVEARKAEALSQMAQAITSLGPNVKPLLESSGVSLTSENGNHSQ